MCRLDLEADSKDARPGPALYLSEEGARFHTLTKLIRKSFTLWHGETLQEKQFQLHVELFPIAPVLLTV